MVIFNYFHFPISYCKRQKLTREKLCGFHGFSMNCKSFPYKCFEQWERFNADEAQTAKVLESSKLKTFLSLNFCRLR